MSPTRTEPARLRLAFFVYTGLLNRAVPCRTGPAQHVSVRVYTDITNRAVPCRAGQLF